jgi:DNA (cytosine-5)-methyltransferase 1
MNYYNENDANAATRLRALISAGLIPDGYVDQRSIADVRPEDLTGFAQCHFFAGIGGWPEALRLAGVSPDTPLWTGSCPCQPFSAAGKRKGTADERHLWPVFCDLIAQCRPAIVFGEQVASADGRDWLAVVRTEMEALGYAVGAADLCAAGVGAPHIRQRLYFIGMADADCGRCQQWHKGQWSVSEPDKNSTERRLADADFIHDDRAGLGSGNDCRKLQESPDLQRKPTFPCTRPDAANSFWASADWLFCRDGKWRPVEPGTFPLAHGVSGRVAQLRGYGNAIVPQVAATFIRAALTS